MFFIMPLSSLGGGGGGIVESEYRALFGSFLSPPLVVVGKSCRGDGCGGGRRGGGNGGWNGGGCDDDTSRCPEYKQRGEGGRALVHTAAVVLLSLFWPGANLVSREKSCQREEEDVSPSSSSSFLRRRCNCFLPLMQGGARGEVEGGSENASADSSSSSVQTWRESASEERSSPSSP